MNNNLKNTPSLRGFLILLGTQSFSSLGSAMTADSFLATVFGLGKGSGAACLFFLLGFIGIATCLIFRRDEAIWALEEKG